MTEQDPLLPSSNSPDAEQPEQETQPERLSTWRNRVAEALESASVHKLVITLVRSFPGVSTPPLLSFDKTHLLQTIIDATCVLVDLGYTLLTSDCDTAGAVKAPSWLEVLALISTIITTLFLVEIPLTLWSLGFEFYSPRGRFPHATLHIFDAVIIVTTFVLEVVLRGRERELAGLLIILRLWRLLKLVGGELLLDANRNDSVAYT